MLRLLNNLISDCSQSWWKFLLVVVLFVSTLLGLQQITNSFMLASGGSPPFDMQNNLQPAEVFQQLENYSEQAFMLYGIFQAVDYLFPFCGALMIASVCAYSLRQTSVKLYKKCMALHLFVLLMLPAVFDYLENLNFLWVVIVWPEPARLAANLGVAAKHGKLATMNVAFALAGILLLTAILSQAGKRLGIWGKTSADSE